MRPYQALILLPLTATAAFAATPEKQAAAERFAAALTGESGFLDSDFVRPLTDKDKAVFERYRRCRAHNINSIDANRNNAGNADPVMVRFSCKGTPKRYPIYVSIFFQGSKILTVATHNADLLAPADK